MAETSHRSNPDRKDLGTPVPLDSHEPESQSPAAPEDLPGARSEMLPREESDAVARMADAQAGGAPGNSPRPVKPDETAFFGFPHPVPAPASQASAAWDEDEDALQERLRKWMADARLRRQIAEGTGEPQGKEPSASHQRLAELQRTMIMGSTSGDPTLAETPEAHAKIESARRRAAMPLTPVDPMATIMVPADQFLGAKSPIPSRLAPDPQPIAPERPAGAPGPLTREEALTRKIAVLRRNAEMAEDAPARMPPTGDNILIAGAIALFAVLFVVAIGLFAATQAGMFDGLESRFEFLRPNVSAGAFPSGAGSAAGAAPVVTEDDAPPAPVKVSGPPPAPADKAGDGLEAHLLAAAKEDAPNLLTLYGGFARRFPGLTGEVRMQLTVGSQGRILAGNVTSSTTGVAEFDKAVLLRVMGWRLGQYPESAPKIVTFPLLFPLRGL